MRLSRPLPLGRGQASMWPRSRERGNGLGLGVLCRGVDELQCGRVHVNAEMRARAYLTPCQRVTLQCGRVHVNAEITSSIGCSGVVTSLQCGRVHVNAE